MINILTGNNQFLIDNYIKDLSKKEGIIPKTIFADDGKNIIDEIMARDLFISRKILIIKNLSKNKELISQIVELFAKISDDQDLFLLIIEYKLDKRLKLSKMAIKNNVVHEFDNPKEYDYVSAIKFIVDYGQKNNLKIEDCAAKKIWQLVGNDSLLQVNAVDKLSVISDNISLELVEKYIDPTLKTDSFLVIDNVFAGNAKKVKQEINKLERTNVVSQMFWGLIMSQIFNLVVIKNMLSEDVKVFKIHPFVVKKMRNAANNISDDKLKEIIEITIETDKKLKSIPNQDWLLIKIALLKITNYFK